MEWLRFEHEIRELVEAFGYQAETTTPSHDYGVDVIARSSRRTIVIQCKLYGKGRIGGDAMMKLVGSRQYFKVSDAICITTSRFTKQAKEIAANENIRLVDKELLLLLCRERNITIPSLTVVLAETGEIHQLQELETYCGRDISNRLVLPSSLISRRHAVFKRKGLTLTVQDCGSTNGTFFNGTRISDPVTLNYNDEISLGKTVLTVAMQTPNGVVQVKTSNKI